MYENCQAPRHVPLTKEDVGRLLESTSEYDRMLASLELYHPRLHIREWIYRAYHDPEWDWEDSDGCSCVSELHFPEGCRFPPCVMHDYFCECGERLGISRATADQYFFEAMRDYRVSLWRATLRYTAVRVYGIFKQLWRYRQ